MKDLSKNAEKKFFFKIEKLKYFIMENISGKRNKIIIEKTQNTNKK
jgi:hypothetical protein